LYNFYPKGVSYVQNEEARACWTRWYLALIGRGLFGELVEESREAHAERNGHGNKGITED
jgi:hypothetical protein